jgi:hypothetical protein
MGLATFCNWLEGLGYSAAIRDADWLFPSIETVHVLALTLVVGSIVSVDLRLLGITSRQRPLTHVLADVLPVTWGAFGLAAVSGFLLFSSAAVKYSNDGPFRVKLVLLGLAGLNMILFHSVTYRRVSEWDTTAPPAAARLAGAISLLLWIGIVFCGRWVGFTTTEL